MREATSVDGSVDGSVGGDDATARVERSMLFVPASQWAKIVKAAASEADAVCIDLEDSLAEAEKAAGRANAIRAFAELDFGQRLRMFRINAVGTAHAESDIVEVVEGAGDAIDLVMVPKVGGAEDILFVDRLLSRIESGRLLERRIGIEAQIETAAGFVWLREIAASSQRLEGLIFGPGDYSASMGIPSSGIGALDDDELYPGHRWHAVMHAIVAHARAFGLRAIDGPYGAYKDAEGFARSCRIARSLGFDGKQCIHPAQLAVANDVFSPSAAEVASARQIVDACEAAGRGGRGVASMGGEMIDAASERMARMVLARDARVRGDAAPNGHTARRSGGGA